MNAFMLPAPACGNVPHVPTVAIIDGVRIDFYFDEHPPPHFHARYAEFIAQVDIGTLEVIKGSLPTPQLRPFGTGPCLGASSCGRRGTRARPAGTLGELDD